MWFTQSTTCLMSENAEHAEPMFWRGDKVRKVSGYKWPGIVISRFQTLGGETRYVVECTNPDVAGALHIYSGKQLVLDDKRPKTQPAKSLPKFRKTPLPRGLP